MFLPDALRRQLGLVSSVSESPTIPDSLHDEDIFATPELAYTRLYTPNKNQLLYEGQVVSGTHIKQGEGRLYNPVTSHLYYTNNL
jgi:hypothetical protein